MPERSLKRAAVKLSLGRIRGKFGGQVSEARDRLGQEHPVRRDRRDPAKALDAPEKPGERLGLEAERGGELAHPGRAQLGGGEERAHALPQPLVFARQAGLMSGQPQQRALAHHLPLFNERGERGVERSFGRRAAQPGE